MTSVTDAATAIVSIEGILGKALPSEYRNWLLDPSANHPFPSDVTIPDDPPWTDEVPGLYTAQQALQELKREHDFSEAGFRGIPAQFLAIGENGMGDYFLLSLGDADSGAVSYLFHEACNPDENDWEGNFALSPTFSGWIQGLIKKEQEPDIPDWDSIRKAEFDRILHTPKKRWWQFW